MYLHIFIYKTLQSNLVYKWKGKVLKCEEVILSLSTNTQFSPLLWAIHFATRLQFEICLQRARPEQEDVYKKTLHATRLIMPRAEKPLSLLEGHSIALSVLRPRSSAFRHSQGSRMRSLSSKTQSQSYTLLHLQASCVGYIVGPVPSWKRQHTNMDIRCKPSGGSFRGISDVVLHTSLASLDSCLTLAAEPSSTQASPITSYYTTNLMSRN